MLVVSGFSIHSLQLLVREKKGSGAGESQCHPHRETLGQLTWNKQYKTVGPQMTALAGLHAKLLLRRYILPESRMKRTVIIDQSSRI